MTSSASTSIGGTAPGPRPYPLVGMLPYMRRGLHTFFLEAARTYGGVVQLGRPDRLLLADPAAVRHVLVEHQRNYIKGRSARRLHSIIGNGLPAADGQSWLAQRRLMQPAFHRQRLGNLATMITDGARRMLEHWDQIANTAQVLDIDHAMAMLTQQVTVALMFGGALDDGRAAELGRAFATLTDDFALRESSPISLPEHWHTPHGQRVRRARQTIATYVHEIIAARQQSGGDQHDLLAMLLEATDDTGQSMDAQQLFDEIRTIFFAGYDTTAHALAWACYLLATHPAVQERAAQEARAVLGSALPTVADLAQLPYLRMVIDETLRLYPPGWITARIAVAADCVSGVAVPADAKVLISPYVTHRLPDLWENPDQFDPERFTTERVSQRPRDAYFPFGMGPRLCIGYYLALLELQLTIAMILQQYELRPASPRPVHPRPVLLLQPHPGVRVSLRTRRGAS